MAESLRKALLQAFEADRKLSFYGFTGMQESLSFSEFGRRVETFRLKLQSCGIGPGKVVAVMGPTSLDLATACAAVWICEATLTVLPTPTRLGNLEQFLNQTVMKLTRSQASVLLGDEDSVSVFKDFVPIPVLAWNDLEDQGGRLLGTSTQSLDELRPALIQFSSGTTREPQPILLSEEALLHNSRAVLKSFPGGAARQSCVSWLPLYHDMGLLGCYLMPLLAPCHLTLMGPEVFAVRPLTWLEAITEQRGTISSAPNFALAYCADRITEEEKRGLDLSSWEISMVGAETVRPQTLRRFAKAFGSVGFDSRAFSPVYGLAEATLAVTFSPLGGGLRTLSYDPETLASEGKFVPGESEAPSLGQPLEGVQVEIRQDGRVLPDGELGDVWVKSPSLLSGILTDGLVSPLKDGWLDTGDAGFIVEGDLYLYGRRRDILLLDGRNHDPDCLEEVAENLEALRRCCAFCLDVEGSERDQLVLICELASGWAGDRESLRDVVRSRCRNGVNLVPDRVVFVTSGDLPITSSGKLRRGLAAKMLCDGELTETVVATV